MILPIQFLVALNHAQQLSAFAKKISLQNQFADLGVQALQLYFIGGLALLAGAKYRSGLIKQLLLPVLYLVLMPIKLRGNLCQCHAAFDRCQRRLHFEPRQMVLSFAS